MLVKPPTAQTVELDTKVVVAARTLLIAEFRVVHVSPSVLDATALVVVLLTVPATQMDNALK
jgi:hypothetical protein